MKFDGTKQRGWVKAIQRAATVATLAGLPLIGTSVLPPKASCLAGLFATSANAEEAVENEKSYSNEDGDFIAMEPAKTQKPSEDEAGIGVRVVQVSSAIVIDSVMENGPAAQRSLKPGDEVVTIDGRRCLGLPVGVATKALRGRSGTLVVLTVRDKQTRKVRKYSFNRVPFSNLLRPAAQKQKVSIRNIRVSDFAGKCPKEHQGCHFLYQEKENCTFTCPST